MQITIKDLIKLLNEIATYMELNQVNPFKIRAFNNASNALERLETPIDEVKDFTAIKGIGKGVNDVIIDYMENGESQVLTELKDSTPDGLVEMMDIEGLGAKSIAKFHEQLNIDTIEGLKKACESGEVSALKGFGPKKEQKILEGIKALNNMPSRFPIHYMIKLNDYIESVLKDIQGIQRYSVAGSFRRGAESSKDLDYVVSVNKEDIESVQRALKSGFKDYVEVVSGQTKLTMKIKYERYVVSVDFRFVDDEAFITTLHHFTGSKHHNVEMRRIAKSRNESISEYGVTLADGTVKKFDSEREFFEHFSLPYIHPAMRESGHEVNQSVDIDAMIRMEDIRSDLHMHTTSSDGAHTLVQMIEAARSLEYEYICITDHSKYLTVANGLNAERLLAQNEEIKSLNEQYDDIDIYSGIEMDILPDGTLDFDDDVLSELDFVIASIHSNFNQSEEEIMKRIESAMNNQYVDLIAHPTGRILHKRKGYDVNMEQLIQLASDTNTALEINANPMRLDLSVDHLALTKDHDVFIAINTDAHHIDHLNFMKYGVHHAMKAFVRKEKVINHMSKEAFKTFIETPKSDRHKRLKG